MSEHNKQTTNSIKEWLYDMSKYRHVAQQTADYIDSLESSSIQRVTQENELLTKQVLRLKLQICELKNTKLSSFQSSSSSTGETNTK